jgi:acetate kinase
MKVLVLNSGSSSQKSALFELGDSCPPDPPAPLWQANLEWNGGAAKVRIRNRGGIEIHEQIRIEGRQAAIAHLLRSVWNGRARVVDSAAEIDLVGHRVVHGGPRLYEPVVITPEVKAILASVSAIAPLHNRAELEGMEIIEGLFGAVRQIAVFDTGFHHALPLPAAVYPGPYAWFQAGIRRYGFHGINHQYCAERAAYLLGRQLSSLRIVSCHLGNGCSLAAIAGGKSVDTTMGFTPLDGLMMGTRSGSVDPGILTYLMRQTSTPGEQLDNLLNQQSGLLGISGVSGDMREIQSAIAEGNSRARLAFDIYVHRLRSGIGAMAAVMGGLDALVFTAGVGEHSPEVRSATCEKMQFLGIELDPAKNARSTADQAISAANSRVAVLVIEAQEDWAIAKACWTLAGQSAVQPSPAAT